MRLPALTVFLVLAAAGCLGTCGEGPGAGDGDADDLLAGDPFEAARAAMAGVPCEATVGAGTSDNLRVLANMTFDEGGVGDIDVRGDVLATTRSLHDIRDPMRPVQVANFSELEIGASGD